MEIIEYIRENFLIAIPVLNSIGFVIKNSEIVSDKKIPLILLVLGIIIGVAIGGFNIEAMLQGVLVGTSPIGLHQLAKNINKKRVQ